MKIINLEDYFLYPKLKRQRQYETVRAFAIDKLSAEEIASQYNYSVNTVYALVKNSKAGKIKLFPAIKMGPKQRSTSIEIQQKIFRLRNKNLSTSDIREKLQEEGVSISVKTIERILKDAGFSKLKRRNNIELGRTTKNKIIPKRSEIINFAELKPFSTDCPVAGIFFFIPYIIESGIIDIVKSSPLPESTVIGSVQACLSMLALKLIGNERLSNMYAYDHEVGLGVFPGLNVLPKSTYMSTYSCLSSESVLADFQKKIIKQLRARYSDLYKGNFINLDFHSIPHFGEESEMQKIWCGARGKAMKAANTIFAQDSQSNLIIYTRADILRKEESQEIKKFISYWKDVKGEINETLVFDCKFTKYEVLDEISQEGIKFITLQKRYKGLVEKALDIPKENWVKTTIPVPKRKYQKISVCEKQVVLKNCESKFRQIIIKDHGRSKPTFILTNDMLLPLQSVIEVYAKRWHVENKLSELVSFFNLNALSSPLMIRIHFDILWTMIADTLYRILAQDLRRFENNLAPTIHKKFINMPGRVVYDGHRFIIKIRKRAHTPILKGVEKLNKPFVVPWLDNKSIEIVWTN